jgi:hypothetical protein
MPLHGPRKPTLCKTSGECSELRLILDTLLDGRSTASGLTTSRQEFQQIARATSSTHGANMSGGDSGFWNREPSNRAHLKHGAQNLNLIRGLRLTGFFRGSWLNERPAREWRSDVSLLALLQQMSRHFKG